MSEKALAIVMFVSGAFVMIIIGYFLYMVDMNMSLFTGIALVCILSALTGYCFGIRRGKKDMRERQ